MSDTPADMLRPASEEEAVEHIRAAAAGNERLALRGGGTRGIAASDGRALTSPSMTGITDYEPAEMVMIARAGTPVSEIEAALDAGKQRMIFEPMDHRPLLGIEGEPTIGSLFAANISGPRRFVAGAARDALLGCRFINGKGEAIKAGGRVMKNVTGLDLVKLMCGSRGTLGLLTEVTFKVVPQVEAEATLVIHGLTDARAAEAMAAAMATPCEVTGAAHVPASVAAHIDLDGAATLLRLEGFDSAVALRLGHLREAMGGFGELSQLDTDASRTLWGNIRDARPFTDQSGEVWRISTAPMNGHRIAAEVRECDTFYDWQGGLVWMFSHEPVDPAVLRCPVSAHGGHATLVRRMPASQDDVTTIAPQKDALASLSDRVTRQFDPHGIFAAH